MATMQSVGLFGWWGGDGGAAAGPDSIQGKLALLVKLLINLELIVEDPVGSGNYFLKNFDSDDLTEIRKCALKTIDGLPYVPAADEITQRERTSVTATAVALTGSVQEKLDKLLKHAENNLAIVESPAGSGRYYQILRDNNDRTILVKNHLLTYSGQELPSPATRGEAAQRLRSEV